MNNSSEEFSNFDADAFKTMGQTSFGSQTDRFGPLDQELKRKGKIPGPGNYYGFGAGNISPKGQGPQNHPFNDSRILDEQWNNKSVSLKFGGQTTALQGLSNPVFKTFRKRAQYQTQAASKLTSPDNTNRNSEESLAL